MKEFSTHSDAALYLWDYFYISNLPSEAEAKTWRQIEFATDRIRNSISFIESHHSPALRIESAKLVCRAVREILRCIEKLDELPEGWIARVLGRLQGASETVIEEMSQPTFH